MRADQTTGTADIGSRNLRQKPALNPPAEQEGRMPTRKTPLREASGVKLTQVDDVSTDGTKVRSTHYRLTTLRPNPVRLIADQTAAQEAFDLEVIASVSDPVVQGYLSRGH